MLAILVLAVANVVVVTLLLLPHRLAVPTSVHMAKITAKYTLRKHQINPLMPTDVTWYICKAFYARLG